MSAWGKGTASTSSSSWADASEKDDDVLDLPPVEAPPLQKTTKPVDEDAFPSLASAANKSGGKKKKEKQKQTLSLSEFTSGTYVGPGGRSRSIVDDKKGLTAREMQMLPKGPRERAEGEDQDDGGRGGFRGYGGYRGDRFGDREDRDRDRDRGRGGPPGAEREEELPSREDGSSDWGADRKFAPSSADRGGRGGGFRERFGEEREREGPSKADEAADWGAGKKFAPSASTSSTWNKPAGRGFDDGGRLGALDERGLSRADEVDNWGKEKKFVPSSASSSANAKEREPDRWGHKDLPSGEEGTPGNSDSKWGRREAAGASAADKEDRWLSRGGSAASEPPRERPRLNLQKRSVPAATELPAPAPAAAGDGATVQRASAKADPFGGAKPREVVLAGKGVKPGDLEASSSSASASEKAKGEPSSAPAAPGPQGPLGAKWGKAGPSAGEQAEGSDVKRPELTEETRLKGDIAAVGDRLAKAPLGASEESSAASSQDPGATVPDAEPDKKTNNELAGKQRESDASKQASGSKGGYASVANTAWKKPEAPQDVAKDT